MTVDEIRALPTREKLHIMEVLWDDFREHSERAPVSQEIKDMLDARRARFRSGQSSLYDWDAVRGGLGRS